MFIPIRLMKAGWLMLSGIAALGLLWSCELDQGLGPSKTKIRGHIIFMDPAERPDSTIIEDVRVVATASLPPAGFGEVYISGPVKYKTNTPTFEISAPLGTYSAIGVLWKPVNRDWSFTNLLGIYDVKLFPPEFTLKSVQLTEEHPVVDTVDISAYWSFSQFDARVEGELTVLGNWPADTEIVLLGAFATIPDLSDVGSLLASLGGLPLPISNGATQRPYGLAVRNGEYKFVAVFWKGRYTDWDEIRLVGYYRDPRDASRPGTVDLRDAPGVDGINFVADFNTLPDGLPLPSGQ
jgi:hypothetical protein